MLTLALRPDMGLQQGLFCPGHRVCWKPAGLTDTLGPSCQRRSPPADQSEVQVQLHRRRGGEDRSSRCPHRALSEVGVAHAPEFALQLASHSQLSCCLLPPKLELNPAARSVVRDGVG